MNETVPAIIQKYHKNLIIQWFGRRRKEAVGVGPARRIDASQPIENARKNI